VWKRHQHESELRKILIVGGGPLARCIASTLRNDPLRRATICGSWTTTCLFLRQCWGEWRTSTGWRAPSSSTRSSSCCRPTRPDARGCGSGVPKPFGHSRRSRSAAGTVDGRLRRSHRRSAGGHLASGTIAGRGFVSEAGDRCNGSRTWDCGGQSCHGGRGPADPAGLAGFGYLLGRAHGGQRAPLPLLQVSLHGDQCRAPQGRVTRTEPETRADFQDRHDPESLASAGLSAATAWTNCRNCGMCCAGR